MSFWVSCSLGALGSRQFPLGLKPEPLCVPLTGVLGIVPLDGQGEDKRQVTHLGCHSGEWRLDPGSPELAPPSLGAGIHTHLGPRSLGLPVPLAVFTVYLYRWCPYWKAGSWLGIPLGWRDGKLSAPGCQAERGGYALASARHRADAGSQSLWRTQPYGVLSPFSSPGGQPATPHHQPSSPAGLLRAFQGGGWLGCRPADGPSQRDLLSTAAASGGAQQPAWQSARSEGTARSPRPAAALTQLPPLSLCSCGGGCGPVPLACWCSWPPDWRPWLTEGG